MDLFIFVHEGLHQNRPQELENNFFLKRSFSLSVLG